MSSIWRKYRHERFEDAIFQEKIQDMWENELPLLAFGDKIIKNNPELSRRSYQEQFKQALKFVTLHVI